MIERFKIASSAKRCRLPRMQTPRRDLASRGALFLAALLSLFPTVACAASIVIDWDADPNATSYRVYSSVDTGASWQVAADSPTLPITVTGLPDTGLILLRPCAVNATQEACRTETGFFFNGDWLPMSVINLSTP